jgi:hypothetical protein
LKSFFGSLMEAPRKKVSFTTCGIETRLSVPRTDNWSRSALLVQITRS